MKRVFETAECEVRKGFHVLVQRYEWVNDAIFYTPGSPHLMPYRRVAHFPV